MVDKVTKLQEALVAGLQAEISQNHRSDGGLFPRLLMVIPSLRELSCEHRKLLHSLREGPDSATRVQSEAFGVIE